MRVQVNISDTMVKRLDLLCKDIGVSRSAFCSIIIGQAVVGYEKTSESIDEYAKSVLKDSMDKATKA